MDNETGPLVEARGLMKYFPVRQGLWGRVEAYVKAVDGVSFDLWPGETLGVVGESGCGKSTLGRLLLRLIEPTAGSVRLEGTDLLSLNKRQVRVHRRRMQMVFQDPYSALNPRLRVGRIIGEALRIHRLAGKGEMEGRVARLLDMVGLPAGAVSARIQRRPAPAHRHRPGPGRRTPVYRRRRTGIGPGCVDPGTDHQFVAGFAARSGFVVFFHHPRSGRGPPHRRSGGGDVPRASGRSGAPRPNLRSTGSSLYQGLIGLRANPGSGKAGATSRVGGGCTRSDRRSQWLFLSPPMSGAPGGVHPVSPGLGRQGRRPPSRLSALRDIERGGRTKQVGE